ncbi:hypothetical protein P3X46_007523 [Hevea brasiliensis]|uniref:Plant PDR ABC transporter associated domain-containing protein n=1 Tax=Hevea brasiliensis TaxID=3981 RepID=A0ABQ9MUT9_HEVBR|nr:uncharacterized protein LOC110650889 [Hevea brasiliensis]KAJ9183708.1 hypothetical protein P3X46_007523 [Hevea brasiliensis]
MNVLDSPIEALAFDYVSFGIFAVVNNLWTWVALVMAAVSFWRIRNAGAVALSGKSETLSSATCIDGLRNVNDSKQVLETSVPEPATQALPPQTPSSSGPAPTASVFEDDGVTRGTKFVMYYENERESDGNEDDELTVVGDQWGYGSGSDDCYGGGLGEWWERVIRMRKGDMGWYMYQDLTAINGNVVRLWDGKKKQSSSCGVW